MSNSAWTHPPKSVRQMVGRFGKPSSTEAAFPPVFTPQTGAAGLLGRRGGRCSPACCPRLCDQAGFANENSHRRTALPTAPSTTTQQRRGAPGRSQAHEGVVGHSSDRKVHHHEEEPRLEGLALGKDVQVRQQQDRRYQDGHT